ncbi:MAG: polyribonucleotide nucleotidyltransferase, partial [Thermoanaerobaculum sp.]
APSRREIGHGKLAENALLAVIPSEEDFPYIIRVVSDILESNGSSSMATVCGGTLALMDAGVPIIQPVAGIAMGLVSDGQKHAVLTDIAGQEDHYGDMDFKVAGTREGVTALQMDIKVSGLSRDVLEKALEQAKKARLELLDIMSATIAAPRPDISPYAPRIINVYIDPDKIRDVIGPGGKTIRAICEQTGARITIEDDGRVEIASPDLEAAHKARQIIENLTRQVQVGEIFEGTVKRIEPYGAFIEILPNQDGLLHISEIAHERIREVTDVLKLGDRVTVKVIGIDAQDRIKLSRKALLTPPPPTASGEGQREERRGGGPRGSGGRPPRRH